jgi:hypothetical protein
MILLGRGRFNPTRYNYLAGRSDIKGETLERLMAVLGLKIR